jgi:putative nucleotidyltransferase with HDIG domain
MKNYSYFGPLIAIIFPLVLFECFKNGLLNDPYYEVPRGHFFVVSAVSILAFIIAIAIGIVGRRVRNIKVDFLSLSFISLAQMFSLHGLSTPHFLIQQSHLPGIAAQLSMLLATIWLWFSSFPTDSKLIELFSRRNSILFPAWIIALFIFELVAMLNPHILHFMPMDVKPLNWFLTAVTLILNLITMYKYYQSYRFSRFPLQLTIVYSSGWIIVSQFIMVLGEPWRLSWWIYHFLLLASMIVMIFGLIKQYSVKGTFVGSVRTLFVNDPFERITSSISRSVKALVIAIEEKDTYTVGHTFRVTMYALKLAEEMNLNPEQLRAIAQGTLVHDVGKIHIPDAILNKPGKLTNEERELIEKHSIYGYKMCRNLGFMKEELNIIRSHHEKWDGSGYPDKLKEEEIPFLARIVAVADVYDALTSERAYRKAWTHQSAIELLIDQKGKHFDPICVDAWVNLCEKNPEVYQYPAKIITEDNTDSLMSSL